MKKELNSESAMVRGTFAIHRQEIKSCFRRFTAWNRKPKQISWEWARLHFTHFCLKMLFSFNFSQENKSQFKRNLKIQINSIRCIEKQIEFHTYISYCDYIHSNMIAFFSYSWKRISECKLWKSNSIILLQRWLHELSSK